MERNANIQTVQQMTPQQLETAVIQSQTNPILNPIPQTITVVVEMDGKAIASAVANHQLDYVRSS
jgi:hypothetical protein